jgi:hypothetical protein
MCRLSSSQHERLVAVLVVVVVVVVAVVVGGEGGEDGEKRSPSLSWRASSSKMDERKRTKRTDGVREGKGGRENTIQRGGRWVYLDHHQFATLGEGGA